MTDNSSQRSRPAVVRSFWHGPFSPYEALCLSSFVAAGIRVELFSDRPLAGLPDGVVNRGSREILDRDVAHYQHEFDGPSPSLHSNHFRYAMLERLGGWWIDTDVMLVGSTLPDVEFFIARQNENEIFCGVMHFPAGHPLLTAARQTTEAMLPNARWGETGPKLVTRLIATHAPEQPVAPRHTTYAIEADEFQKFFLPAACDEIEERLAGSTFVHLWNEMWRKAGIPKNIAPPKGSWLDKMFERYQVPAIWSNRLEAESIERWAALRRDRDHAGYYNLIHSQELTRLRAEMDARTPDPGLMGSMRSSLRRWLNRS